MQWRILKLKQVKHGMEAEIITVRGKIPFLLLLDDSINENGEPIYANAIELTENNDELMVNVFTKKKLNENQKGIQVAIEDLYGEFTFSEFLVIYNRTYTKTKSLEKIFYKADNWDTEKIALYTTELLNKLVEIYKAVNNNSKDWIPFLTHFRLSPLNIRVFDNAGKRIGGVEILDFRGTGQSMGNIIGKDQLDNLKNYAKMLNVSLKPAAKFIQEANRYKLTGDYVSSVLFLAFHIEKWIFSEVKFNLSKKGKSNSDINNLLEKNNGRYIDRYEAVKLITGDKKFKNLKEFKEYELNVTQLRDEIVHRDRVYIDKEMAEKAVESTMNFRNKLLGLFKTK